MLTVVTLLNHKCFKYQNAFSFFQKTSSMKLNFILVQQRTQKISLTNQFIYFLKLVAFRMQLHSFSSNHICVLLEQNLHIYQGKKHCD